LAFARGALDLLAYLFAVAMILHMLSNAWDAHKHAGDELRTPGLSKGLWKGPMLPSKPPSALDDAERFSISLNGNVVTGTIASSLVRGGPATRQGFHLRSMLDRNEDSSWEMVWDTALGQEAFPGSNFSRNAALLSLAFDKPASLRTVEVHWGGGTWVKNVKAHLRGSRAGAIALDGGIPDVAKAVRIRVDGKTVFDRQDLFSQEERVDVANFSQRSVKTIELTLDGRFMRSFAINEIIVL